MGALDHLTHAELERVRTRLDAQTEKADGCWLWIGVTGTWGYGAINVKRRDGQWRTLAAHRVSYMLARGEIPPGLQIDHLCQNRLCVRPDHLEVVTQTENIRRGNSPSAVTARTGVCGRGHSMTPENTYRRPDGTRRWCKECARARNRASAARRREVVA